jgi:hypothetical protein
VSTDTEAAWEYRKKKRQWKENYLCLVVTVNSVPGPVSSNVEIQNVGNKNFIANTW